MISDTEYRFDRVQKRHVWPALLWEAGRDACASGLRGDGLVWAYLQSLDVFPAAPWLALPEAVREALASRFSPAANRAKDGAELLHFHALNFATPDSAEAWREQLGRMGCVVLNLGAKGRHTRAELVSLFEAWLDASPDWIAPLKRKPSFGRRAPEDGLRAIAWRRVFRWFSSTRPPKTTADAAAVTAIKQMPEFKAWMRLPATQPKRSKLSGEAQSWCVRLVDGLS